MQCMKFLRSNLQKLTQNFSIDPPGVKELSRGQKLSRSIHQVLRCCRDCDKKKLRKLDRELAIKEVSRRCQANFSKTVFQEEKKHWHECNQVCNSTNDPNNILSSQVYLLTKIFKAHGSQKHTYTLNKSNQFYVSNTSQDSLVSIH